MAGKLEESQEKLREGHAVLEQRVAERTVDLQRMDTERRELLADISHELRTRSCVFVARRK